LRIAKNFHTIPIRLPYAAYYPLDKFRPIRIMEREVER
jgi:hypothetical protein